MFHRTRNPTLDGVNEHNRGAGEPAAIVERLATTTLQPAMEHAVGRRQQQPTAVDNGDDGWAVAGDEGNGGLQTTRRAEAVAIADAEMKHSVAAEIAAARRRP